MVVMVVVVRVCACVCTYRPTGGCMAVVVVVVCVRGPATHRWVHGGNGGACVRVCVCVNGSSGGVCACGALGIYCIKTFELWA